MFDQTGFSGLSVKRMRKVLKLWCFIAPLVICEAVAHGEEGETLYNGILLPSQWPPRAKEFSLAPMEPPYLVSPPPVIPVDVGRQLFVDDFLIGKTTLIRTHHTPVPYSENPVLKPEKFWEGSCAMAFSDGVWYDPREDLFKMWYMGGNPNSTCYATSKDGILWDRPSLDVKPGTNIVDFGVWGDVTRRDANTIWLDPEEKDPSKRYKMFKFNRPESDFGVSIHFSNDGIHWSEPLAWASPSYDRTTAFYNPFRKVWVYSIKDVLTIKRPHGRYRRYHEGPDPITSAEWEKRDDPVFWVGADNLDPPYPGLYIDQPELYNLDAVAYESILLGLFTIWKGPAIQYRNIRPKRNELYVGFSRDGFNWSRPLRLPFIGVSENSNDWNWGNVQSVGGCCLVIRDKLYFYYSGRTNTPGSSEREHVCSTGLAVLRRDGFVSMDAGEKEGILTTRPVIFCGKYLFVNTDTNAGELYVEVLDKKDSIITPFSRDNCIPVRTDSTIKEVHWNGAGDLSSISGKAVKFRFYLQNGSLYSFWVSSEKTGASNGYIGAGGPGFTGNRDTVGLAAYKR